MSKPPYAEDRTYGGVRGSGETIVSHSLLDYTVGEWIEKMRFLCYNKLSDKLEFDEV